MKKSPIQWDKLTQVEVVLHAVANNEEGSNDMNQS